MLSLDTYSDRRDTLVDASTAPKQHSATPTFVGGRYRLHEELGHGGVGSVHRATCLDTGREVAIKLLHERYRRDPDARLRFLREAEAARLVRHRNVVEVIDTGVDLDGTVWFAQELLTGWDLRAVLQERPLSVAEARDLAEQLLSGLVAVHARGWLHRDIKPENIFLHAPEGERATIKLLDFGIAIPRTGAGITGNGIVLGTPAYMAPERTRRAELGPEADLWSVGAVLFEALAGRPPFEGRPDMGLLVRISTEAPPAISDLCDVPLSLAELIDRALRTDPSERFRSASQMLAALTEHASDISELDW